MKKALKWAGISLLGLLLLALLSSWILASKFNREFTKAYELDPAPMAIPSDSASLDRGRMLATGCQGCHGQDLAGKVFFDDPGIGVLPSSNLTRAKGSETEGYTSLDFVRAIRHGLNKQGNVLMVMPSEAYANYSDEDLGCLIAYLESLPPIERTFDERRFTYMAQVMAGAGLFGEMFSYNKINHEKAGKAAAPPIGASVEYGAYVARFDGCAACHGANFGGGKSPDPVSPPVPDITRSGNAGQWTLEQFTAFFRTGTTPDGRNLNPQFMPYEGVGGLTDVEIEGLYRYIQSLPPAHPNGSDIAGK